MYIYIPGVPFQSVILSDVPCASTQSAFDLTSLDFTCLLDLLLPVTLFDYGTGLPDVCWPVFGHRRCYCFTSLCFYSLNSCKPVFVLIINFICQPVCLHLSRLFVCLVVSLRNVTKHPDKSYNFLFSMWPKITASRLFYQLESSGLSCSSQYPCVTSIIIKWINKFTVFRCGLRRQWMFCLLHRH